MHGSSQIPELYLYVGHIYFTYFCTIGHKFFFDKFHFDFSSAYYIDPYTLDATHPYGPHAMPYVKGYLYGEEPHNQWYCPEISNITHQSIDSNPKPTTQVTWSDDTKPPASSGSTTPLKTREFQIGIDLTYCEIMGKSVAVVCKGSSSGSLTHTIRLEDKSNIQIHDRNLQIIDQPDFSNLPKTPLDYRN